MARPKGSKNNRTILFEKSIEDTVQRLGINMFESLCLHAMGDWKALGYDSDVIHSESGEGEGKRVFVRFVITPEMRLDAIKTACKYLYSQKQSVDPVTGDTGIKIIVEDYTRIK